VRCSNPGTRNSLSYSSKRLDRFWGTGKIPPYQGIKPFERVLDPSPPFRAEVRNDWSQTPTPLYAFIAWTGTASPLTQEGSGHY